jgi:hypothetical protein
MTDGECCTRWPVMDLPHNSNPRRKSMQVYFVGSGLSPPAVYHRETHQDLPFVASFAADMTPPVICLICSPALVN